jgi:hypothetical protein
MPSDASWRHCARRNRLERRVVPSGTFTTLTAPCTMRRNTGTITNRVDRGMLLPGGALGLGARRRRPPARPETTTVSATSCIDLWSRLHRLVAVADRLHAAPPATHAPNRTRRAASASSMQHTASSAYTRCPSARPRFQSRSCRDGPRA